MASFSSVQEFYGATQALEVVAAEGAQIDLNKVVRTAKAKQHDLGVEQRATSEFVEVVRATGLVQ